MDAWGIVWQFRCTTWQYIAHSVLISADSNCLCLQRPLFFWFGATTKLHCCALALVCTNLRHCMQHYRNFCSFNSTPLVFSTEMHLWCWHSNFLREPGWQPSWILIRLAHASLLTSAVTVQHVTISIQFITWNNFKKSCSLGRKKCHHIPLFFPRLIWWVKIIEL